MCVDFRAQKLSPPPSFRLSVCVCCPLLTATALLRSHKDQLSSHRIMLPSGAVGNMDATTKSAHAQANEVINRVSESGNVSELEFSSGGK